MHIIIPHNKSSVWTFIQLNINLVNFKFNVSEIAVSVFYTFLLIHVAVWFALSIIRLSSTIELLGNENLREESMVSISVLRGLCLFQSLSQDGNGHSLDLCLEALGKLRK
jgi:hypothetical protein